MIAYDIPDASMYSRPELDALADATARAVSGPGPHTLVEIGSYCGRSAAAIGLVLKERSPGSVLWCIDPHTGMLTGAHNADGKRSRPKVAPSLDRFRRTVNGFGLPAGGIVARSQDVLWPVGLPISLLHLDGDHTTAGVTSDWERFGRHIRPGGVVVFHDYNARFQGVGQVVDRLHAEGAIIHHRVVGSSWIGSVP